MKRRTTKIGILGTAVFALLVWMGCAGALMGKRGVTGSACTRDTDCPVGFCDLGACVELVGDSNLGAACNSAPPAGTTSQAGQPDPVCGGLLCVEGRCRSCRTDTDCASYLGTGKCDVGLGRGAGISFSFACSLTADRPRYRDAELTSSLPCANLGPGVPVDQRLAAGFACTRDCDCRSGFCDRGACADTVHTGRGASPLGRWCQPHAPISPEDLRAMVSSAPGGRVEHCSGYLCVDHRCRSCISDAECQVGVNEDAREYKCLPRTGEPGKRCGRPNEKPEAPRSMPTQEELDEIKRDLQEFMHPSEP